VIRILQWKIKNTSGTPVSQSKFMRPKNAKRPITLEMSPGVAKRDYHICASATYM
jgi:hypothetical protein